MHCSVLPPLSLLLPLSLSLGHYSSFSLSRSLFSLSDYLSFLYLNHSLSLSLSFRLPDIPTFFYNVVMLYQTKEESHIACHLIAEFNSLIISNLVLSGFSMIKICRLQSSQKYSITGAISKNRCQDCTQMQWSGLALVSRRSMKRVGKIGGILVPLNL